MAIFKTFNNGGRDRAAEDRRRHHELIDNAIKKNIGNIIAEESIIGQSKNKKIKIPIRGIKEYQFVYGKNGYSTGAGRGDEERGQRIGKDEVDNGGNNGAGSQEGEEIFETEITIEEIVQFMFDDLNLPRFERKKFMEVESESNSRKSGYQRKGIPPRLAKRKSAIEKIKRKKASKRVIEGDEKEQAVEVRFPFREEDLRYFRVRKDVKKESNAVVICIMDVSGSMDQTKKYFARSFYFLLYQFIKHKYVNVEVVFVAHTTSAKEVTEQEFFHRAESGGTYISSGYNKAMEIIEARYNPSKWNVYAFHCSDGDNWSEDNDRAVEAGKKLCEVCNLFGYIEIKSGYYATTIRSRFAAEILDQKFSLAVVANKEDIWAVLKKILDKEKAE